MSHEGNDLYRDLARATRELNELLLNIHRYQRTIQMAKDIGIYDVIDGYEEKLEETKQKYIETMDLLKDTGGKKRNMAIIPPSLEKPAKPKKPIIDLTKPKPSDISKLLKSRDNRLTKKVTFLEDKGFKFKERPEIIEHGGAYFKVDQKGTLVQISAEEAKNLLRGYIFSIQKPRMRAELMLCYNGEIYRVMGVEAKIKNVLGFVPPKLGE